jgi:hypothetical protein
MWNLWSWASGLELSVMIVFFFFFKRKTKPSAGGSATQEAEIRRIMVERQPPAINSERPYLKNT